MALVVGIDARAAAEVPAGRGRYVRELLAALAALPEAGDVRFRLYARERWSGAELDERFSWALSSLPDPLWHLAAALRASRECDVFLSTNSYLTVWATRIPAAIVVYDLVPWTVPQFAQAPSARIERATIGPALRRAAALLCISEATRADLVRLFPATAQRASVVALAADAAFAGARAGEVPARHGLDGPYVLAVGTLEPRKNLERLVSAWTFLDPAVRERHTLALVGPRGWDDAPILAAAHAAGAKLLGRVSDADLAALYAGCAAFCYPSLYEGFGLPVLEAMLAGAPVVTADNSSLPEVGGDAALQVDAQDTGAIAAALARVLSDAALAQRMREAGRAQAATFSWARTASQTLGALRAIARQP